MQSKERYLPWVRSKSTDNGGEERTVVLETRKDIRHGFQTEQQVWDNLQTAYWGPFASQSDAQHAIDCGVCRTPKDVRSHVRSLHELVTNPDAWLAVNGPDADIPRKIKERFVKFALDGILWSDLPEEWQKWTGRRDYETLFDALALL